MMKTRQAWLEGIDKWLSVTAFVFGISAIIFFLTPTDFWPDFYSPIFFGSASLASVVFIITPKYLLKTDDRCRSEVVLLFRLVIAVALVLNGLGELYLYQLYKIGFQYDKLLHLAMPFLFVVVLTAFQQVWWQVNLKKAIIKSVSVVLVFAVLWEVFEFASDTFFKTSEFGIYGQVKFWDTTFDLLSDFIGVGIAAMLLNIQKFYNIAVLKVCRGETLDNSA